MKYCCKEFENNAGTLNVGTMNLVTRFIVQKTYFLLNWRVFDTKTQQPVALFDLLKDAEEYASDSNIKTYGREPRSCPQADYTERISQ